MTKLPNEYFDFGMVSIFQIALYDHVDESCSLMPWTTHVADFAMKLPALFNS